MRSTLTRREGQEAEPAYISAKALTPNDEEHGGDEKRNIERKASDSDLSNASDGLLELLESDLHGWLV